MDLLIEQTLFIDNKVNNNLPMNIRLAEGSQLLPIALWFKEPYFDVVLLEARRHWS